MKRDLPHDPELLQALEAEAALGRAYDARHRGDLALALEHALNAHAAAPLALLRAAAGWLACLCHHRLGQHRPLLALGDSLLPQLTVPERRLELLRWLALAGAETGHFAQSRRWAAEAMALAEDADDASALTTTRQALALCFERMGDPWRAEQLLAEALPLAEGQPVLAPLLGVLQQLAANAIDSYHLLPPGPADTDDAAPDLASALAAPRHAGDAQGAGAQALARAEAYAQRAQALAERVGDTHFHAFLDGLLGEALLHQGCPEEAWPRLERALCEAESHGHLVLAWRSSCALAEGLLLRQLPGAALERLQDLQADAGERLPHTLQHRLHAALARACGQLNQPERARLHLGQASRLQAARAQWQGLMAASAH